MADITASLVKELRDKTGAGMMDCKKALSETDGDLTTAADWLREKGKASAAKKAGRVAAEGLVGVATDGAVGAMIELNSETDFVSRNTDFQAVVAALTKAALEHGNSLDAMLNAPLADGGSVSDGIAKLIAAIGENITLRRTARLSVANGVVASYVHSAAAEGMGRIGVLVALESDGDKQKLAAVGRQIAMHVAAAAPQWLEIGDVDKEALDRERSILTAQASESGKPPEIVEKMVEGRLRKFYKDMVLLEQT